MEISEEQVGTVQVLAVSGRLDSNTAPAFEEKLLASVEEGSGQILVDFEELDYISSAGLRVLLMGAKRCKAKGGQMRLCTLGTNIYQVFEVSGFLTVFPAFPTREKALAAS